MIYIRNCDKDVPHSFVKPDGGYPMWSMTRALTHLPLDQDVGDPADDNLQSMMLKDNILFPFYFLFFISIKYCPTFNNPCVK